MAVPVPKYRFGPFDLFPSTRELLKQGSRLKVRPQPYQVLVVLLEHGGDVVTREELRERVWRADTFVDFEHGLNTAIKELRAVLSDSATEPRYIETIPKVGYRMIAPVEEPQAEAAARTVIEMGESRTPIRDFVWSGESGWTGVEWKKVEERQKSSTAWIAGVALMLLAAAGTGFGVRWVRGREASNRETAKLAAAKNARVMLAVLPFQNLTGDAGQEYFSDGLTEEMIAQLGLMDPEHFGVIARTSVMHYKSTQENAEQIGRELGVQYVLEGSVRRDAERVRITAQLIRAGDQTRLWTKEFDREVQSLLAVQSEIALETADEIQQTLGTKKPGTPLVATAMSREGYEAYDQYLKGLYLLNKRTVPGFEQAIACFQVAIKKNPRYAPAYAGLANTYTLLTGYSMAPSSRYMPQARAAALRAVELDPLSLIIAADRGVLLYFARDYDRAIEQLRVVLEMDPDFTHGHMIQNAYAAKGMYKEAITDIEKGKRGAGEGPWYWSAKARVYGQWGHQAQARRALEALEEMNKQHPVDPAPIALAHMGMGHREEALRWLEKAYEQHSNTIATLKVEPIYDSVRDDSRFQALLRRVGLGE